MGHNIQAIITLEPVDAVVIATFDLVLIREGQVNIIPLDMDHSNVWTENLSLQDQCLHDIPLCNHTTLEFARRMGLRNFAVIETEFFGGVGTQAAAVYQDGKCTFSVPHLDDGEEAVPARATEIGHINYALKLLGLEPQRGKDRFETAGLHKYRGFDDYFEKYWDA